MKPPEFASHWAQELGTARESLVQLRGGINNHVFRCGSHGQHWVIKGYPSQQPGQRDRMQAEVEFLRYAQLVAPGKVPELLAVDNDSRCVVLEYIDGSSYPEGVSPPAKDVQAAFDFFRQLNTNLDLARQMIQLDAAEGFLSLREHMANVRERLAAMGTEHLPAEFRPQAGELLEQLLRQADRVEIDLEAKIISGYVEDRLDPELRCISPSDFGFHNAIRIAQGVRFIDFEFAGWDDPAKAAVDFALQPKVPVRQSTTTILEAHGQDIDPLLRQRYDDLISVLKLKWICIVLAVLREQRFATLMERSISINSHSLVGTRLSNTRLLMRRFEVTQ